jgi:hypothetical protein
MKLKLGVLVLFVLLAAVFPPAILAQGPGGSGVIPQNYPPGTWQQITVTFERLPAYTAARWQFVQRTEMWNGVSYMPAALIRKWIPSANPMLLAPVPAYPYYRSRDNAICGGGNWHYDPRTGRCYILN